MTPELATVTVLRRSCQIDKGVPVPTDNYFRYPFRRMEVGDSFFVPFVPKRVQSAAAYFTRRNPQYRFCTRTVKEKGVNGVRCWRVP